jgi:putative flippase GtrA
VLSFCLVGGVGLVVDVSIFNLLRLTLFTPGAVHGGPVLAKVVSTSLAIAVNWVGNRFWTFRERRREDVVREGVEFVLASLAGLVVSVACLWISHYLLGFRTVLDDNLSGNLVGLGLGTVVRFVLYRWWVYGRRGSEERLTSAAPQEVDAGL